MNLFNFFKYKKKYRICPNNHIVSNSKDKFCYACGSEIILSDTDPNRILPCPKCKNIPESRLDRYCVKCGTKLIK